MSIPGGAGGATIGGIGSRSIPGGAGGASIGGIGACPCQEVQVEHP